MMFEAGRLDAGPDPRRSFAIGLLHFRPTTPHESIRYV